MDSAHGAWLMLVPVVMRFCLRGRPGLSCSDSPAVALTAVGVHMAAMLAATAAVAIPVYEWLGLGFLRRGWINLDLIWTAALAVAGLVLLV